MCISWKILSLLSPGPSLKMAASQRQLNSIRPDKTRDQRRVSLVIFASDPVIKIGNLEGSGPKPSSDLLIRRFPVFSSHSFDDLYAGAAAGAEKASQFSRDGMDNAVRAVFFLNQLDTWARMFRCITAAPRNATGQTNELHIESGRTKWAENMIYCFQKWRMVVFFFHSNRRGIENKVFPFIEKLQLHHKAEGKRWSGLWTPISTASDSGFYRMSSILKTFSFLSSRTCRQRGVSVSSRQSFVYRAETGFYVING